MSDEESNRSLRPVGFDASPDGSKLFDEDALTTRTTAKSLDLAAPFGADDDDGTDLFATNAPIKPKPRNLAPTQNISNEPLPTGPLTEFVDSHPAEVTDSAEEKEDDVRDILGLDTPFGAASTAIPLDQTAYNGNAASSSLDGLPGEDEDPGEGVNIFAQAYGAHMAFGAVFREPITTEDLAGMYGKGDDPELLASDDLSQAEVSSSPQSLDQVASSPRSANQLDISEGLGQLHEDDGANQLDSGDATGKTSTDSYAEDVLSDNNPRPSGQDDSSRHPSHSHEIQANPAADDVDPVNDASPINIGGLDTEEKRPPAPSWARAVEDSVAGRVLEAKVRKAEGLEEIKAAESEIAIKDEVIRLLTKKLGRLGHFSPSPTESRPEKSALAHRVALLEEAVAVKESELQHAREMNSLLQVRLEETTAALASSADASKERVGKLLMLAEDAEKAMQAQIALLSDELNTTQRQLREETRRSSAIRL